MTCYVMSTTPNSHKEYEVHHDTCFYAPDKHSRITVGYYSSNSDAMFSAKRLDVNAVDANGCRYCMPDSHRKHLY